MPIGEKTIVPLVRLGLLERADGEAQHLRLSVCEGHLAALCRARRAVSRGFDRHL